MKKFRMIALTGGIGSGKSAALKILSDAGYKTLSCDAITSELYEQDKIKRKLQKLFPSAVSGKKDLIIDRKAISAIVFNDKIKLEKLTALITPRVLKEVKSKAKKLGGVVFVEVPLLFERSYQKHFDAVIVIMRDKRTRIESVKTRSNLSEEQIISRMNNQFDYDSADLSDYAVVYNNGSLISLKESVLGIAACLDE